MSEKGGSLNKKFVAIFVFFGLFAILLATMPSQYASMGMNASVQNKEAVDFFSSQNVTVYNNTETVNLTRGSPVKLQWGLPTSERLEFWWDNEPRAPWMGAVVELRHLTQQIFGYWVGWHRLEVQQSYRNMMEEPNYPKYMQKEDVVTNFWVEEYNASYVELACEHIMVKLFIVTANQSWTLEESWNNNQLSMYSSYNIDWNKTSTSAWGILMQLLTFQNPELGIPGNFGLILSTLISLTLWGSIGLIAFAMITALVPFVSGWGGD